MDLMRARAIMLLNGGLQRRLRLTILVGAVAGIGVGVILPPLGIEAASVFFVLAAAMYRTIDT